MRRVLIMVAGVLVVLGLTAAPAQAAAYYPAACTNTTVCTGPAHPPQGHGKPPSGNTLRGCAGWGLGLTAVTTWYVPEASPVAWLIASGACLDGLAGPNQ
jgi:hypothetical protein